MKSPAVLFYTGDFLIGTAFMSYDEIGKYIKLLCLQHQRGHILEEDFYKICEKKDIKVIEKFKLDKNGNYFNKRMDEEIDKRNNYSKSRSLNRSKIKENKTKDMKIICNSYDKHMDNENDNVNIYNNKYYNNIELNNIFIEYLNIRKKLKAVNSEKAIKLLMNKLDQFDDETKIKMIENSIQNSWKSVYPLKENEKQKKDNVPEWFDKEIKQENLSDQELKEMEAMISDFQEK